MWKVPEPGLTMAAVLPVLLTALPVLFGEQVPPPVNPTVLALNTDYTLHWDWHGIDRQNTTFTVQYIGKFRLTKNLSKYWKIACDETSNLSCDLKPLSLQHYLSIFTLRVRANVNGNHSEWVCKDFAPAKDAAVGHPSRVDVSPVGSDLEVFISPPQTSDNTSMKEKIPTLYYRFMYWERHTDTQAPDVISTDHTIVTLGDLKSWTWYCVSVQSRSKGTHPKNSTFTDPVCIRTQGEFFSWQIILIFLASLLLGFLLVLGIVIGCFRSYKVFQNNFNVKVPLPAFLDQHFQSSQLHLSPDCQSEQQCDLLTVIPEPGLQIYMLSSSQQHVDSSGRHSWESSSGSQDSGVYSTKSNSGNQTTKGQSSAASSGLSSGPEDALDQLSLQDICLVSKNVQLIPDEGFGDISI